jgi:2-hydroxy-6-oxonona-2,4-dienedioate hydrolase
VSAVQERLVEVDGLATRYLEAGGAGDPVIVLLHGGEFGSYALADDWLPLLPLLADRFRIIAIDLLGCGSTDNPTSSAGYLFSAVAEHAARTIQALGLERVHLIGHSRGGFVATLISLDHPELVATLGIVGGGTLVTPPNPIYGEWAKRAATITDPRERVRYLVEVNSYSGEHIDDLFVERMSQAVESPKSRNAQLQFSGEVRERFHEELADVAASTRSRIRGGELTVPTLIVWGYDDPSAKIEVAGAATMDLFLTAVPAASMHIMARAGHYCFRERPEQFAALLAMFIRTKEPLWTSR